MENSFYKDLVSRTSIGYAYHRIVLDDTGRPEDYEFLDVNQAFKKLTGLHIENIVHKRVTELLPEIKSDPFDWIGFYGHVALNGENWEFEQFSQPLGRWYRVQVFSPERLYFVTLFIDTTDHKLAEEALRASEAKFRLYIDNAPDGIFVMDEHGRFLDANPAACTLLGYTSGELSCMSLADAIPPDARDEASSSLAHLIERGRDKREIRLSKKDGASVPVALNAVRLPGSRFMFFFRDIGEQQQAKTMFEGQKAMLQGIIDSHAELVFSIDDCYRYTSFNRAYAEGMKLIYGADIRIGANSLDCMTVAKDRAEAKKNFDRALRGERFSTVVERGDQARLRLYLHITLNPIIDEYGAVRGIAVLTYDISERRRMEESLHDSEERYRKLTEASFEGIAITEGGVLIDCNAQLVSMLGREFSELNGKPVLDVIHPDDREKVRRAMSSGNESPYEARYIHRDGSIIHTETRARRIRYRERDVSVAVIHDITARKLAELALQEREQRFESLLSSSPSVIYAATPEENYRYTFISANAVDLHGYEATYLIENPRLWLHSIHPDDAPRVIEEFLRLDKTGGCTNEYRLKHRDGHYIWVRDTARLLRDAEGRPREIIGASIDISERKKHEILQLGIHNVLEAVATGVPLENSLNLLMRVIEEYEPETVCSILVLSDDGKHLTLGAAPNLPEGYNRAIDGLAIGPDSGSCGTAAFTKKMVVVEDIAVDPKWEKLREAGLSHNLRACWSQPVLSSDRKLLGTFAMYARVPRRPTERELYIMDTASHIAGIIIERRNAERSLIDAKEAAEEANRVKTNFLANVSHELRTPLNAILGFSQILEMKRGEIDRERELEFLGYIRQSGEHLLEMVNDILDLSKIESGRFDLEKNPFDLREMLSRVLLIVKSLAEEKGLAIDCEIEPDLGIMTADELRLKQVIFNLLSNAIKFTPKGKRIGVRAAGDGGRAVITVWDEGIGITEDDLEKIFDPFEQAQRRRGEDEQGTGLGLSITKKIIELHGGTLEVRSAPGEGSSFTMVLPGRSGLNTDGAKGGGST